MKVFQVCVLLLGFATLLMALPFRSPEFQDETCSNDYPECEEYAKVEGYCDDHKVYMGKHCSRACGFCQPQVPIVGPGEECKDRLDEEQCQKHAANEGYCDYTNTFMRTYCAKTCDLCEKKSPQAPSKGTFEWRTTPWSECENGVQTRGVQCWHYYENKDWQVDLKACRINLPFESEPEEEQSC